MRELISNTLIANTNIAKEHKGSGKHYTLDINSEEDKHELVLWMKDLACRGMAAEVVEEVNALDPNFFAQNPTLLFQLKQVEFLKLVSSGDHSGALKVASSHLGPLAAGDPTLLKPLKETLLTLLQPNEKELDRSLPLHALATSLQVAIGRKIGIKEPQLIKIRRKYYIISHAALSKSNMDSSTHGSSQVTVSSSVRTPEDNTSPTQVSSGDLGCDENAILKVMVAIGRKIGIEEPQLIKIRRKYYIISPAALSKSNMDSSTHGSSQVTVSSSVRTPEDNTSPTQVSSGDLGCDENAILKVMTKSYYTSMFDRNNHVQAFQCKDAEYEQWCIADEQTPQDDLHAAMDWACEHGGANCSMIQENNHCFN
ncbi:hypothetical protein ACFE04_013027 [Oxalis oulophora]